MEEMTGVVDSVIFDSGDGRFSVFRLTPDGLCHGELMLTPEDVRSIETIEKTNYTDNIYGTEQ